MCEVWISPSTNDKVRASDWTRVSTEGVVLLGMRVQSNGSEKLRPKQHSGGRLYEDDGSGVLQLDVTCRYYIALALKGLYGVVKEWPKSNSLRGREIRDDL